MVSFISKPIADTLRRLILKDTLWASGYELYDRLSKPYQSFLDGLTATYAQPGFADSAKRNGFKLHCKPRGSPENIGSDLIAEHPVIRTNPVTGWKSVFAIGHHVQHINGLTEIESQHLLGWFAQLIVENHDLQVRHRWQNPNDIGRPRTLSPIYRLTNYLKPSGTIAAYTILPPSITMALASDLDVECVPPVSVSGHTLTQRAQVEAKL